MLEMGSRFTVTLPLVKADQLESKASYYTASHHLSGCSVLSIDNDRMLLDMLHDMFEQSGIHSEICMDINQLMERLRGNCYDLLTTDLKCRTSAVMRFWNCFVRQTSAIRVLFLLWPSPDREASRKRN